MQKSMVVSFWIIMVGLFSVPVVAKDPIVFIKNNSDTQITVDLIDNNKRNVTSYVIKSGDATKDDQADLSQVESIKVTHGDISENWNINDTNMTKLYLKFDINRMGITTLTPQEGRLGRTSNLKYSLSGNIQSIKKIFSASDSGEELKQARTERLVSGREEQNKEYQMVRPYVTKQFTIQELQNILFQLSTPLKYQNIVINPSTIQGMAEALKTLKTQLSQNSLILGYVLDAVWSAYERSKSVKNLIAGYFYAKYLLMETKQADDPKNQKVLAEYLQRKIKKSQVAIYKAVEGYEALYEKMKGNSHQLNTALEVMLEVF